eukprot:NODE_322_length_9794_cov_0.486643.p1 type:complete len:817 gc:universal NODE_322_length_9794_cov_0.486643:7240-9690(+)
MYQNTLSETHKYTQMKPTKSKYADSISLEEQIKAENARIELLQAQLHESKRKRFSISGTASRNSSKISGTIQQNKKPKIENMWYSKLKECHQIDELISNNIYTNESNFISDLLESLSDESILEDKDGPSTPLSIFSKLKIRPPRTYGDIPDYCIPLNIPFSKSPSLVKSNATISDKLRHPQTELIVLAGVSGAGKTTLSFSLSKSYYLIYSEVNGLYGDKCDFLLDKLKWIMHLEAFQKHQRVDFLFRLDLFARLLCLLHGIIFKSISKTDWLLSILGKSAIKDTIESVYRKTNEKNNISLNVCCKFIVKILGIMKVPFLIVRDEAQVFSNSKYGTFKSDTFEVLNLLEYSSQLYTKLGCQQILSGTRLTMNMGLKAASTISKPKGVAKAFIFVDFPYFNEADIKKMFSTMLDLNDLENSLISSACFSLQGRARYVSSFIVKLLHKSSKTGKSDTFKEYLRDHQRRVVKDFSDYLRDKFETWRDNVQYFQQLNADFKLLLKLLLIQKPIYATEFYEYGIIPFYSEDQLGCIPIRTNNVEDLKVKCHKKMELFVLEGLFNFFNNKFGIQTLLKNWINVAADNFTPIGNELDFIIMTKLALCGIKKMNILKFFKSISTEKQFKNFEFPDWIKDDYEIKCEKLTRMGLAEFCKDSTFWNYGCLPCINYGSDGVFIVGNRESNVFASVGICSRNGTIEVAKVKDQIKKLDLRNQCLHRSKINDQYIAAPNLICKHNDIKESVNKPQILISIELPKRGKPIDVFSIDSDGNLLVNIDERNLFKFLNCKKSDIILERLQERSKYDYQYDVDYSEYINRINGV